MSRASLRSLSESIRSNKDRFLDLRVDLVAQDERGHLHADSELLISTGGRWDRLEKRYIDEAKTTRLLGLHAGQMSAARALVRWFEARTRDEVLRVKRHPVFSMLFHGGRRAGKTDLGGKAGCAFAAFLPRAEVWFVSENYKKTVELSREVKAWLPRAWYDPHPFQFALPNGSTIWLKSAHEPESLKSGKCDFALLNEAQNMDEDVFAMVRAATADNSGLTVIAANPPDEDAKGWWVETFYEETRAGKRPAMEFFFDNALNPHVNVESLEALKDEVDERTYLREIKGMFLPRRNVVFYAWSDGRDGNVQEVPSELLTPDVTTRFVKRHFGGGPEEGYTDVVGCDFQLTPHMAGVLIRFFQDPHDPKGEPLIWFVDYVAIEKATEDELIDTLEAKGLNKERTLVIADASGEWQDAERTKGRGSFDAFRRRGWRWIYPPDPSMKRNPNVLERVQVANSLMKNASGKRRLFSSPDNLELNQALKRWENSKRYGKPNGSSLFSHLCDAATYPLWRFYPRKLKIEDPGIRFADRPRVPDLWGGDEEDDDE